MPKLQLTITTETEMSAASIIEGMLDDVLTGDEALEKAELLEDDGETIINDNMLPVMEGGEGQDAA